MLTEVEKRMLDFEGQWWQHRGSKEDTIVDQFGVSVVRYYQLLTRLLDRPEALAYAPTTVNRLRRITHKDD